MQCRKEFSIVIAPAYPWSTLVWDQCDGYAGTIGGTYQSACSGPGWSGRAIGGTTQMSVAAGHAAGIYNGPLLNCLVTFNLIQAPTNPNFGASFNILQNGVSRISKTYAAGTIVAGSNVYAFTLLNTLGADQSIEVQGGQSLGPPVSTNNCFIVAVNPGTVTQASISIELP